MRDWQVGDPVGDGNDIGVPDTKYMGYLKDKDSYREDIVDDFKFRINHARDEYNMKNYQSAFHYLNSAHSIYNKMTDFEKSQLRDEPFNQDWMIDLSLKCKNTTTSASCG